MAFKTKRNAGSQLANNVHSEKMYDLMALWCHKLGLIELTDKQLTKILALEANDGFEFKIGEMINVLSNGKGDTFKHVMRTPALSGSPIYESNRSSQKIMQSRHVLDLMNYLNAKDNGDDVNAVFLTFSFTNADFGHLADAEQSLNDMYKRLKEYMKKTMRWGNAEYLGTMPSMELTINKKRVQQGNDNGIYHVHFHVIVFFSGEKDLKSWKNQLWKKFQSLCKKAGVKVAESAFFLEETYSKSKKSEADDEKARRQFDDEMKRDAENDDDDDSDNNDVESGIMEASKYIAKPEDLLFLTPKKHDSEELKSHKKEIWAEIYNASVAPKITKDCPYLNVKGKKATKIRNNGSGLFQKAVQIFNAIVASGLGGVFDFQKANGDITRVPNFFTNIVKVIVKGFYERKTKFSKEYQGHRGQSGYKYNAEIIDSDDLTLAEILYYNRNLLENAVLPGYSTIGKYAKDSKYYNDTPKQRAVLDVLKNFIKWNTGVTDIHETINDWIKTVVDSTADDYGNYDELRVHDLSMIQDAIDYSFERAYQDKATKVRNFKELDVIKRFDRKIIADNNDDKILSMLTEMGNNGEWVLHVGNADVLKPYIEYYVALTTGKKMESSTKEKAVYGVNDWNYWKGVATEDPTDKIKHLYHLLMVHFAKDVDSAIYTALTDFSEQRKISVVMDDGHVKSASIRLMKQCDSANNYLFKDTQVDEEYSMAA